MGLPRSRDFTGFSQDNIRYLPSTTQTQYPALENSVTKNSKASFRGKEDIQKHKLELHTQCMVHLNYESPVGVLFAWIWVIIGTIAAIRFCLRSSCSSHTSRARNISTYTRIRMSLPFRALGLGGGGVKGILHIGALLELSKKQELVFPDGVYGISVGSVIGTYIAFGLPVNEESLPDLKKQLKIQNFVK